MTLAPKMNGTGQTTFGTASTSNGLIGTAIRSDWTPLVFKLFIFLDVGANLTFFSSRILGMGQLQFQLEYLQITLKMNGLPSHSIGLVAM